MDPVETGEGWQGAVEQFLRLAIDSPSTRRVYRLWLYRCFALMDVSLTDLTGTQLAELRQDVLSWPLAPSSQRQCIAAVRSFLRWGSAFRIHPVPQEQLRYALRCPPKKTMARYAALTDSEASRLLGACRPGRDWLMVSLMMVGGLRISEVASLDVGDFVAGKVPCVIVRDPKGGEGRSVPTIPDLTPQLVRHCAGRSKAAPMFMTRRGQRHRLHVPGIREIVHTAGRSAQLGPIKPHALRNTCAFRLLEAGADLTQVARLLGHKDIQTTYGYVNHWKLAQLLEIMPGLPQ